MQLFDKLTGFALKRIARYSMPLDEPNTIMLLVVLGIALMTLGCILAD